MADNKKKIHIKQIYLTAQMMQDLSRHASLANMAVTGLINKILYDHIKHLNHAENVGQPISYSGETQQVSQKTG